MKRIKKTLGAGGEYLSVTATFPDDGKNAEELLGSARKRMAEEAKGTGESPKV